MVMRNVRHIFRNRSSLVGIALGLPLGLASHSYGGDLKIIEIGEAKAELRGEGTLKVNVTVPKGKVTSTFRFHPTPDVISNTVFKTQPAMVGGTTTTASTAASEEPLGYHGTKGG